MHFQNQYNNKNLLSSMSSSFLFSSSTLASASKGASTPSGIQGARKHPTPSGGKGHPEGGGFTPPFGQCDSATKVKDRQKSKIQKILGKKEYLYKKIICNLKKKRPLKILNKLTGLTLKKGKINSLLEKNQIYIKKTSSLSVDSLLWKFFSKVRPGVEVKKTRVSGRTVFLPSAVSPHRQLGTSLRWLIEGAKTNLKSQNRAHGLSLQIAQSLNKKGFIKQRKDELNKLAEKNRNFLYLSW